MLYFKASMILISTMRHGWYATANSFQSLHQRHKPHAMHNHANYCLLLKRTGLVLAAYLVAAVSIRTPHLSLGYNNMKMSGPNL